MEVVPSSVDYMTVNRDRCPKARDLEGAIKGGANYQRVHSNSNTLTREVRDIMGRHSNLLDTILPRLCHKMEPYCQKGQPGRCITPAMSDLVATKSSLETSILYRDAPQSRQYLRLGMGPLAKEIVDNFVTASQRTTLSRRSDSNVPQFKLYSGHDGTIGPLLGLLESTDLRWPPYV